MRTPRSRYDDKELVEEIALGKRAVIECFFDKFEKMIYAAIQRHPWAAHQDVGDIYNGFFVHLAENDYRRISSWQQRAALSTYIIALLQNYVRDYYRSRSARPAGTDPLDDDWPGEDVDPEDHFDGRALKQKLLDAKKSLREPDRKILCLRLFRDLEPAECAKELGLNTGAFYTAYHRAEKRLKDAFRTMYPLLFEVSL